ncbi:MAG: hypothetical protein DRG11_06350 [Epsilonproteobacteria bacterium]|nr:MAG: hypothetical protein DRG11_06350 [Campylobacterota bacterium]
MKIINMFLSGFVVVLGLSTATWAACTSALNMSNNTISNVAMPTDDNDAATKSYLAGKKLTYMSDYEEYIHPIVTIGSQVWMADNIYVATYPDTVIPLPPINESNTSSWGTDSAMFSYVSDVALGAGGSEIDSNSTMTAKFGNFYQWSAAMNGVDTEAAQGICPTGWHIPTKAELETLKTYLGANAGEKLTSTQGFSVGFDLALSGKREAGGFVGRGSEASIWSSTQNGANAWVYTINKNGTNVLAESTKDTGASVRCLKNP